MSREGVATLAHHRGLLGFGPHHEDMADHVNSGSRHIHAMDGQASWTADTSMTTPHPSDINGHAHQDHQGVKQHQDVISLQCIDLEEFFMENANSIAGADSKLSSGFDGDVKQYAVSLEPREHVVEAEEHVAHLQQQALHEPPQAQSLEHHQGHTRSVSMSESSSGDDSPTSVPKVVSSPRRSSHELMVGGSQQQSNSNIVTSTSTTTTTAVELASHTLLSHPSLSGQSLLLVPISNDNHVHIQEQQQMTSSTSASSPSGLIDESQQQQQPVRKAARRSKRESVPEENKDEKYWTRRAKNNLAAKRSRDLRREKEQAVMQRVSLLENENKALREQIRTMGEENEALKERLARYETF